VIRCCLNHDSGQMNTRRHGKKLQAAQEKPAAFAHTLNGRDLKSTVLTVSVKIFAPYLMLCALCMYFTRRWHICAGNHGTVHVAVAMIQIERGFTARRGNI